MISAFLIAAVVGIAVGLVSGLLGVGGGTIMVPLFRLVFGMSAVASTATSLFTIIPTSISGAVTHARNKTSLPKIGVALGLGGACTSPLGVWLAQVSPSWLVMLAAALVIAYSSVTMLRKALDAPKGRVAVRAGERLGDAGPVERPAASRADLAKGACIGAVAGVASGYVGLGGGFLMVPLMLSFLHVPMKLASGTSLIGVMILALPATITQCMLGNVDFLVGIGMACGSIPGAVVGARMASRVPERALRFMFAGLLGIAAILLVLKELGAMGFAVPLG